MERRFTSSSQVFLWAGDGGTHICPFSRELSITRSRARDKSCLARLNLELQLSAEGDSEPVASTICGTGGRKTAPGLADWLTEVWHKRNTSVTLVDPRTKAEKNKNDSHKICGQQALLHQSTH